MYYYYYFNKTSTLNQMRADLGEPQPVTDHEIMEEMGLILGEKYIGKNDDKGRKKAFSGAGALSNTYFDTNLVYTFDYFQQFLRRYCRLFLFFLSFFADPRSLHVLP
jgi:hypothetical protein